METATQLYDKSFSDGLLLDPELTVDEWADQKRVLVRKGSNEPGPWRTERTPYLREIMRCLSPSDPTEEVVFMKGSQIGGTECGNNWIGYVIDHAPGPMLVVLSSLDLAKRWSKQRLAPMLETSSTLSEKVSDRMERDSSNTILGKDFTGGMLIITGAESPKGLKSAPCRYLFEDEVDDYPADCGGQGDPCELAKKRTDTFKRTRKIFMVSKPTFKNQSRIEKAYENSDKRRYYVPCPHCRHMQWLRFRDAAGYTKDEKWEAVKYRLVWDPEDPTTVSYQCEACSQKIPEYHKTAMLEQGEWRAEAPGPGKPAGFHISALYSPVGWLSWADIVSHFLKAKQDRAQLKVFINDVLAETWEEGESVNDVTLFARREAYGTKIPAGGLVLTCGVDVQENRLELEVKAWGVGDESWAIRHQVIYGPTEEARVWKDLEEWLKLKWIHDSGVELPVSCVCIDSGFRTETVYNFVRSRRKRRIYATKGSQFPGRPLVVPSGKMQKGVILFNIGTDTCKDRIYARLKIEHPGPGYMHFSTEFEETYFKQLTAEKVRTVKVRGFPKRQWYLPEGTRNEALDLTVLNMAALGILNPNYEAVKRKIEKASAELAAAEKAAGKPPIPPRDPPPKDPGFIGRVRPPAGSGGWTKGWK